MVDDDIAMMMTTIMTKCDDDDNKLEISHYKTTASGLVCMEQQVLLIFYGCFGDDE